MDDRLDIVIEKLAAIESLLKRLPEIMAAVAIQMQEEYQDARMRGERSSDLWEISPPDQR